MADEIRFDFTICHSGYFKWNPGLEYVGGEVSVLGNVDLDLLSHFQIQDICAEAKRPINSRIYYLIHCDNLEEGLRLITLDDDRTYMCELHAEWPTNEITFYVEPEVQLVAIEKPVVEPDKPIAVENPWEMNDEDDGADCEEMAPIMGEHIGGSDNILSLITFVVEKNDASEEPIKSLGDGSVGRAMDDNVGGGQSVGCGEVHMDGSVGQNVDDNATHGQTVGSEDVHMDEPDWLDEECEGLDYPDDIFVKPCAQNNEVPNIREHQRKIKKVNEGEHLKKQVTNKGKKSEAAASDQALDDDDWAEKAFNGDDTGSINSFKDENERIRCLEFNEKTGMSNPQLCKVMKFLNRKVFRVVLREYAVKKPVDIKFKFNEKTKIYVH